MDQESCELTGNSEEDWQIFDILCKDMVPIDTGCSTTTADHVHLGHGHVHSLDLVTTLRSELAAISYKRDRLSNELSEAKSALCSKETECESLRAQAARQSALVGSLQNRLQAAETREHSVQERCDATIQTIQREKRAVDEQNKELVCRLKHLEGDFSNEEAHKQQIQSQFHDLIRKLSIALNLEVCETAHLSPEIVISKCSELVLELQRTRAKVVSTCDTLTSCENELLSLKSISNSEKQRLHSELDTAQTNIHDLEAKCRQLERDVQITRDRLSDSDLNNEKLKEELRGFESRCHRLQTTMDRFQNDRMQFLKNIASIINASEPCETLVKEKIREILAENQTMHTQIHSLRDQLSVEVARYKESQESASCRIRNEESQKLAIEGRLEKSLAEIHELRSEHTTLSDYLVKLARALCWGECSSPPSPGNDTTILAESLLERADRLATHHEHHIHAGDKSCWDHHTHTHGHHHHHTGTKLRRERSCHDIPLKESSTLYTLQRRVRVLREQVQRRDLHLELLRRKLALIEDGARGKCILQGERDDAVCRAKKSAKQIDKLTAQLVDAKAQLAEVKVQLSEAVEYKITSLERARKIDDLTAQICDLETEKSRILNQFTALKERSKSAMESSNDRRCRDETLISSLREDIARFQTQLSDTNQRLSHLQSFRTSVARTLHLRDLPETDLLQRLQTLCSAHQEFTLLSRRFESASPVGDHPCPRFEDPVPPSNQCRPLSSSSPTFHSHHNHHHHHSRSSTNAPVNHRHSNKTTTTNAIHNNATSTSRHNDFDDHHHHHLHPHLSSSTPHTHSHRYKDEHHNHHFDDDFNYSKKY